MNKKFDIIMYTNAPGLGTNCIEYAHRLPFIKGIANAMGGIGKILIVLRYRAIPQHWFKNNNNSYKTSSRTSSFNQLDENLWTVRPTVIGNLVLASYLPPLRWQLRRQITNQIMSAIKSLNMTNQRVAWMTHPYHYFYRGCAGESAVVYECYDEFVFDSQRKNNKKSKFLELELARNAILNIATAKELFDKLVVVNENTKLISNGVMYDLFNQCCTSQMPVAAGIRNLPRPVIGMIGNLYRGYNFELLNEIISLKPSWSFVFVGEVAENVQEEVANLSRHPNFHQFGWRPYQDLPPFLKGFDVAIIPYEVNAWTNTINPNKVYDYFAAGVPVVATPIAELERLKQYLHLAKNVDDFLEGIEAAISGRMHNKVQMAIEVAKSLSWEMIAKGIIGELCQHI